MKWGFRWATPPEATLNVRLMVRIFVLDQNVSSIKFVYDHLMQLRCDFLIQDADSDTFRNIKAINVVLCVIITYSFYDSQDNMQYKSFQLLYNRFSHTHTQNFDVNDCL